MALSPGPGMAISSMAPMRLPALTRNCQAMSAGRQTMALEFCLDPRRRGACGRQYSCRSIPPWDSLLKRRLQPPGHVPRLVTSVICGPLACLSAVQACGEVQRSSVLEGENGMKLMNIFLMILMGALAAQEGVDIAQGDFAQRSLLPAVCCVLDPPFHAAEERLGRQNLSARF